MLVDASSGRNPLGSASDRACEIIAELEGKNAGSMEARGYGEIPKTRQCISIKPGIQKEGVCVQSGAGRVADSVPEWNLKSA